MNKDRLESLAKCAFAVDEALDTLTRAGHHHGESIIMTNLFEALGDARDAVLDGARPALRETWKDLEGRIRQFEDEGIEGDAYEILRDEREASFRAIYDDAWTAAVDEAGSSASTGHSRTVELGDHGYLTPATAAQSASLAAGLAENGIAAVVEIGDRVSRDGVVGVVIDVLPVKNGLTLNSCPDPDTFDIQVDWPSEDDEKNEPCDCPWYDQNELEAVTEEAYEKGAAPLNFKASPWPPASGLEQIAAKFDVSVDDVRGARALAPEF